MDCDLRLPRLLRELDDRGVTLRLEQGRLHVQHDDTLTAEKGGGWLKGPRPYIPGDPWHG